MKKMLLTALVAVLGLTGTAYAQFSQGTIAVGGSVKFSSENIELKDGNTTEESDPTTTLGFSPSVGYFLADDIELGVALGYERVSTSGEFAGTDYSEATSMFLFTPYARKYFSLGETAALFGQANITIGSGKTRVEFGSESEEYDEVTHFNAGIAPGFVFRPTNRIGLELTAGFLGYSMTKVEEEDTSATVSDFGLSLDMNNISLGVRIYLGN